MKVIVIGLGVQGRKRRHFAGSDFVASVDPIQPEATYARIQDVPLSDYEAALVCLPDQPKFDVIHYLLTNNKHVLVEKPLWVENREKILVLQQLAQERCLVCYTAYNHRFEPHFVRMKQLLDSNVLGEIYQCRMFYGNGTARLVRESGWRDTGSGVLADLGSHLLDTAAYWFLKKPEKFRWVVRNCFENCAPDHVIVVNTESLPQLNFEMTLLSWRNHFTCDILAEKGSAHIESLCKWGPSRFIQRMRVLPSGRPTEECVTLVQDDPTWASEYVHFKNLIADRAKTDLTVDYWIQTELAALENHTVISEVV